MFRRDSQKWNELTVKVEYDMCITSGPSIQTQMTRLKTSGIGKYENSGPKKQACRGSLLFRGRYVQSPVGRNDARESPSGLDDDVSQQTMTQ
jgi:hypothetical protein